MMPSNPCKSTDANDTWFVFFFYFVFLQKKQKKKKKKEKKKECQPNHHEQTINIFEIRIHRDHPINIKPCNQYQYHEYHLDHHAMNTTSTKISRPDNMQALYQQLKPAIISNNQ